MRNKELAEEINSLYDSLGTADQYIGVDILDLQGIEKLEAIAKVEQNMVTFANLWKKLKEYRVGGFKDSDLSEGVREFEELTKKQINVIAGALKEQADKYGGKETQ